MGAHAKSTGGRTMRIIASLLCGIAFMSNIVVAAEDIPGQTCWSNQHVWLTPGFAKQFVVLDVRGQKEYDQGHVPEARRVDPGTWAKAFGDGTDADGWSKRIGDLGIDADSRVIVYDDAKSKDAARVWWILRYWGVEDVRILNGGWSAWIANKSPIQMETPGPVKVAELRPVQCRTLRRQEVRFEGSRWRFAASRGCSVRERVLRHREDVEASRCDPRREHLEWSDLIDPETARFKTPEELGRTVAERGHRFEEAHSHTLPGRWAIIGDGLRPRTDGCQGSPQLLQGLVGMGQRRRYAGGRGKEGIECRSRRAVYETRRESSDHRRAADRLDVRPTGMSCLRRTVDRDSCQGAMQPMRLRLSIVMSSRVGAS